MTLPFLSITSVLWLILAVRCGGICYLDEIVEARKDTTVVIHPLADDRRILPMEKHGELLHAPKEFLLAMSYNPGYQSVLKELKQSTRQRFVAIEFNYPHAALEKKIIITETGVASDVADKLIRLAEMTRNLKGNGLDEGASTRLLVHAGKLIAKGIPARAGTLPSRRSLHLFPGDLDEGPFLPMKLQGIAQEVLKKLPHMLRARLDDRQFSYLDPGSGLFDGDSQV